VFIITTNTEKLNPSNITKSTQIQASATSNHTYKPQVHTHSNRFSPSSMQTESEANITNEMKLYTRKSYQTRGHRS